MNLHDRPLLEQMAVTYAAEIERLNDEIARLRVALEEIIRKFDYEVAHELLEIARKALANDKEGDHVC